MASLLGITEVTTGRSLLRKATNQERGIDNSIYAIGQSEANAEALNAKSNAGLTAQMIASAFGNEEINQIISAHRSSINP